MGTQLISALLGIWLMVAPELLGFGPPLATSDRIVGPLITSVALIAVWEVTRPARWMNVALSGWVVLSPLLLDNSDAGVAHVLTGVAVGALSLARGHRRHSFAGGWSSLRHARR